MNCVNESLREQGLKGGELLFEVGDERSKIGGGEGLIVGAEEEVGAFGARIGASKGGFHGGGVADVAVEHLLELAVVGQA